MWEMGEAGGEEKCVLARWRATPTASFGSSLAYCCNSQLSAETISILKGSLLLDLGMGEKKDEKQS